MPPAVGSSTVIRPITTTFQLTIMGAFIVRASFWLPVFTGPSCDTALFVATGDYELPRARSGLMLTLPIRRGVPNVRFRSLAAVADGDRVHFTPKSCRESY